MPGGQAGFIGVPHTVMPQGGYMEEEPGNSRNVRMQRLRRWLATLWRRLLLTVVFFGGSIVHDPQQAEHCLIHRPNKTSQQSNQGYFNDVGWTWGSRLTIGYRFRLLRNCEWARGRPLG